MGWFDRTGKELDTHSVKWDLFDVRLSPDGERLAFNVGDPLQRNLGGRFGARGRDAPHKRSDTDHGVPVWSPDGSRILFGALAGKDRRGIYQKPSSGAGRRGTSAGVGDSDTQVAPRAGPAMADLSSTRGETGTLSHGDIWVSALTGDRKPRLFVQTPVAAYDGQFSPDGRWVAYTSKESGREEVYVVPFDAAKVLNTGPESANANAGAKWLISTSGGHSPRWRRDGKEIFYLAPDSQMMRAAFEGRGSSIEVGTAQPLFRVGTTPEPTSPYDVTPDGKRFVVNTSSNKSMPLTLVVNWTSRLGSK